jgi:hypothetical protein
MVGTVMAKAEAATSFGDYIKKVASMTTETYTIKEMRGRGAKIDSGFAAMVEMVEEMKTTAAESMYFKLAMHGIEHVNRAAAEAEAEICQGEGQGEGQDQDEGQTILGRQ